MSLLLLAISFVTTGVNLILNKAVVELGLAGFAPLYMIGFWSVGIVIGLVVRAVTRHGSTRQDVIVGLGMGAVGSVGLIAFMLALNGLSGVIAFPVRSCGNILLTACVSYAIWRERLSVYQWLGILCAALAIYLLL